MPSVTSTLLSLSQEAVDELELPWWWPLLPPDCGGAISGQQLLAVVGPLDVGVADETPLVLERDLEWMVEALCCDDELCKLPLRDISLEVGRVALDVDGATEVDVLLVERPTRAKRAPNPARRRGSVVLLLLCWAADMGAAAVGLVSAS